MSEQYSNNVNILFVAFNFPPLGGGGVQRSAKFAKYLPNFGINPIIITTDLQSLRDPVVNPFDETLLHDLPRSLHIERIPCPRRGHQPATRLGGWASFILSSSDSLARRWRQHWERALPRLVELYKPLAMYVTLPPFSIGPLCVEAAEHFGLPLVVDFRDAWSQWVVGPYATWLHYRRVLALEKSCLAFASRAVCTSEQTRQDFLRIHPEIAAEKITVIMNGYDREISDWQLASPAASSDPFVIGYVGNFYYSPAAQAAMMKAWWRKQPHRMLQYTPRKEDWLYRSPYFFFRTLACLFARKPELKGRIQLRFAGIKPAWIDHQIAEFGLGDSVEFLGYLDHPAVIRFQEHCDCLLVTSSKVVGGRDYSIAGKTFEYFSMRKPILGFVTDGAQKEILQRSGLAVICDPDDLETSSQKLEALVRGETKVMPNEAFLNTLHRRRLTRRLAALFQEILPKPPSRGQAVGGRVLQTH